MSPRRRKAAGDSVGYEDIPAALRSFRPDEWADQGGQDAWREARHRWAADHGVTIAGLVLEHLRANVRRLRGEGEQ